MALVEPAEDFPQLSAMIDAGSVVFTRAIRGTLEAMRVGDIIEVSGQLETAIVLPCSRCLVDVCSELVTDIDLSYSTDLEADSSGDPEREIGADELGLIGVSGDEIDLRADIEQEIIMALPLQPLCQENCRGLCPVCGLNRNQGSCHCQPPVFHAELAKLRNLKLND